MHRQGFVKKVSSVTALFARLVASMCAVIAASCVIASAGEYFITDLGSGTAYDINSSGQVVGTSNNHAFIWSNGIKTDIGTLGAGGGSGARGINNAGQVIGYSNVSRPDGTLYTDYEPFLWSNGTMTQLVRSGLGAIGCAINNSGQAVGFSIASTYAWSYGLELNTTGSSWARDINDAGQTVGYEYFRDGSYSYSGAVLWEKGSVSSLGSLTDAFAINNKGQVVGITANGHAALWSNGTVTDLGTLGAASSTPYNINNSGQVVGNALTASGAQHAVLFTKGTFIDLDSLVDAANGWTLETAYSINDAGQIVGVGKLNGQTEAFLLTPTPIPAASWLLGSGLMGLLGLRKRKEV